MTASFSERLRYAAYGIAAILALIAYYLLDAETDSPVPDAAPKHSQSEGLPTLRLIDNEAGREAGRDLFSFVKASQIEVQAPAFVPALRPVSRSPDLLADLQVMGLVRRAGSVTILLRDGPDLVTVELGQRFGAGDALSVQSIEGRQVLIVDNTSRTSRTFTLTEE
jgi:hypothetical protein